MAEITTMDRINMILRDPEHTPMSMADIVGEEIRQFKASDAYHHMVQAEEYYLNRSDVQHKCNDLKNRSDTKIERPILKKLVDQKVNYLLSKPWTVETEHRGYGMALNEVFDPIFRRKIKSMGRGAIKSGIAWLQPYFGDDGKLAWMRVPSTELVPLWRDAERTVLDAFIRFYSQTVYLGTRKHTIHRAEFWFSGGVRYFVSPVDNPSAYMPDKEHGSESTGWTEPHFKVDGRAYNWEQVPIVWLRYNEEELPLCYWIKDLIDDINWQTSVTADVLRDVANFVYVLRNYGGTDLDEFVRELRETLAIKVEGDGGVDKLQADLNIDAAMAFLDMQRRDVYDYAAGVDTKDPELGNASGTAINFRYMDLDTDCQALATEFQDTFLHLKPFVDTYLQLMGRGDFSREQYTVIFNADLPVNETDVINNVVASTGTLSQRTLLQNHPWVRDVDQELAQIDEEEQRRMDAYGAGLFDNIANTTPAESGDADGEEKG